MATDKPIKIGMEGSALVIQNTDMGKNADMTYEYTIAKKWKTAVITSSAYGIMHVS